jgi:hypothetical protein
MSQGESISAHMLQVICIYASLLVSCLLLSSSLTRAQEPPYFVTYSDALEEPGNMEIFRQSKKSRRAEVLCKEESNLVPLLPNYQG